MAGIYIHIPFCKQACYYCNFHFSTSLALKDEMVNALIKEIEIRSESRVNAEGSDVSIITPEEKIETIYFGGGTPSLLSQLEIKRLLSSIKEKYSVKSNAEITLEANPDDISFEKVREWRGAGINRLSIGIQSFIERDLIWMNRAHNASQALDCIHLAKEAGFDNFSIDLIFGTPHLTNEEWKENVQKVIDLNVPHIACYALTVEPKTALRKMIELKKKEDVDTDAQAVQYRILMQMMRDAGYEHYEISNFAKPSFRSRHNSSYWEGKKYIGIGPSAHSYDGKIRTWNKSNNIYYLKSIEQNIIPFEMETLTETQQLNEYIMTSLRTIEGMDLKYIQDHFSLEDNKRIQAILKKDVAKEKIIVEGEKIILTDEGKLFGDAISVKLFS
ncbi:MAG: radical SAM family heme chaperone HemW [Ginsengibacter sp.]